MANILEMLAELRQERDQLEDAILTMERLAAGGGKRRGRPPKWMQNITAGAPGRSRKPHSKETRARMAAAQKKRWAAKAKASTV